MYHATRILSQSLKSAAVIAVCFSTLLAREQSTFTGDRGGPTIVQKGGTLYVDGTRADDRIVIHRSGSETTPGEVEVWDVSVSPGVVLGVYSGVEDIDVELLGGDNFLGLYRFEIFGDVLVTAGDGDNQVYFGGVGGAPDGRTTVLGEFAVLTGSGPDEIRMEQCSIGSALIDAGDGDNVVLTGHHLDPSLPAFHGNNIGPLSITTGDGMDLVAMLGSELSTTTIDTAGGDDWVLVGVGLEDGVWTVRTNELSTFSVNTGMGNDLVAMLDNWAFGNVTILTGQQSDEVLLGGFGAPNDFQGAVLADGGGGNDELQDDPANLYTVPPVFASFETVGP